MQRTRMITVLAYGLLVSSAAGAPISAAMPPENEDTRRTVANEATFDADLLLINGHALPLE